jgi:GT2 family glycosyltransferase
MNKRVSIIIVSHNLKSYLERCINTIEQNTERDLLEEIIIVDKYQLSELSAATSFPVSILRLPRNSSFSTANNSGAAAAKGRFICFMNNDIEVMDGWLSPLYTTIDTDPRMGAVGPKMIFPDGSIQFAGYERDPATNFQRHRFRAGSEHHLIPEANQPGPVSALTGACLLLRREDAHFDERYWFGCEDVDLCIQLKQKRKIIYYQPHAVVLHHEEKSRSSGMVSIDFEKNRELFRAKWGKQWQSLLWEIVT